jgi:arylsulfatase
MVTHMDKGIGQLMTLLKDLHLDQNTLLFFVSDNGAAHGPLENAEFFKANGVLRDYKGSLYEGGIRVPMIVRWPEKIRSNSTTNLLTYFPDIMPTLAELAKASQYVPEDIDGLSIVSTLLNQGIQDKHASLYWEDSEYNRTAPFGPIKETAITALRLGKWKGVKNTPDSAIELYDLDLDISEAQDLSGDFPEIVDKIDKIMAREHRDAPPQVDMTHEEAAKLYIPGRR